MFIGLLTKVQFPELLGLRARKKNPALSCLCPAYISFPQDTALVAPRFHYTPTSRIYELRKVCCRRRCPAFDLDYYGGP